MCKHCDNTCSVFMFTGVLLTMFIGLVAISLGTLLMVFSPYEIVFPMVSGHLIFFFFLI